MTSETSRRDYLASLFNITGKVAVVTGGSGLIGAELCRALARAGARVAVLDRDAAAAERVAAEIVASEGDAIAVAADVLDHNALKRARDAVVSAFGVVDILVNSVGANTEAARLKPDQSIFDPAFRAAIPGTIELSLVGPLNAIFAFGEDLVARDDAVIINISSLGARNVAPGAMAYCAAKAGLEHVTRWLAVELGQRYQGRVRVNTLAPGPIIGDRNRARLYQADGAPTEAGARLLAKMPAARPGVPEDMSAALLWLCSPSSSFVVGQVIGVDGGAGLVPGL